MSREASTDFNTATLTLPFSRSVAACVPPSPVAVVLSVQYALPSPRGPARTLPVLPSSEIQKSTPPLTISPMARLLALCLTLMTNVANLPFIPALSSTVVLRSEEASLAEEALRVSAVPSMEASSQSLPSSATLAVNSSILVVTLTIAKLLRALAMVTSDLSQDRVGSTASSSAWVTLTRVETVLMPSPA